MLIKRQNRWTLPKLTLWIISNSIKFSFGSDDFYDVDKRAATGSVLYEKKFLRNFAKFTGKHLCQSASFNKLQAPVIVARVFSCDF